MHVDNPERVALLVIGRRLDQPPVRADRISASAAQPNHGASARAAGRRTAARRACGTRSTSSFDLESVRSVARCADSRLDADPHRRRHRERTQAHEEKDRREQLERTGR